MSVSKQNNKITRPVDTEHLEKLVSQSAGDPRPTSKMHKDELLNLLGKAGDTAPAVPLLASVPLDADVDDDRKTEILEAKQFRHLAAGSQEIKPPSPDFAEEPGEPAAAAQAAEPLLAKERPEPSRDHLAEPASKPAAPVLPVAPSKAGPRIVLSLLVVTIVASAGFLGLQLAT